MIQVNNKFLVIRNFDEVFVNINIIKNRMKNFFLLNEEILDEFVAHLFELINVNDDKREKIHFIINVNGKKKAFGGILKILENKNPVEIFKNFSFQNKVLIDFFDSVNESKLDNSSKKMFNELKETLFQQRKLIKMIIYAHQALIGRIISKYTSMDYARNLNYDELFQSGIFGLYLSILKFDYSKRNKFTTMSFNWIRYRVSEEISSHNINKTNEKDFDLVELSTIMEDNNKDMLLLEFDDLKDKLTNILTNNELEYLLTITSKNDSIEDLFLKNEKFKNIIKKARLKLNIIAANEELSV